MPGEIGAAIGGHHSPNGVSQEFLRIVNTLHISDYYCRENGFGYWEVPYDDTLSIKQSMDSENIDEERVLLISAGVNGV